MRLFFALWPDEASRAHLAGLGASIATRTRGRAVPGAKLHLTLSFLGEVPEDRVAAAEEAASRVRGRAFEIDIDTVGSFREAGVAWAGPSRLPQELTALQSCLESELRRARFTLDSRPFAAHATLARRIARSLPQESVPPIPWHVRDFVLVRSETGRGGYVVMERWNLEG